MPYPDNIDTFRDKENLPGITYNADDKKSLFVEDMEALETSVIAIEATLGENPQGPDENVVTRLSNLETTLEDLIDAYKLPVGSIYTSINSTNPATSLGYGTWSAFGAGRVPVGFDSGQAEFDTDEETGGQKTHTLSVSEMPSHQHAPTGGTVSTRILTPDINNGTAAASGASVWGAVALGAAGGGGAHNNLQPYIVVRMWKRTA